MARPAATRSGALQYGCGQGRVVAEHQSGAEKCHGRIEQRSVKLTDYLDWFEPDERKPTLNLLRADQSVIDTMRSKRIRAALCEKTLETFLKINHSK